MTTIETPRTRNPIGSHVPVAGGLAATGIPYATTIEAEALQVFVANPRGWATPEGNPEQDAAFRAACARYELPAFVHAPYLINFGSHTEETARKSVFSLRHSLRRGRAIGARGVVVHTGAATGGRERAVALAQARELMMPLLDELASEDGSSADSGQRYPDLLLEPTAGQGASLCSQAHELAAYFEALEHHPRLGVCLDTCHIFAAGHDLTAPGGVDATLTELVAATGQGRLKLIHANDSKDVAGAHKDRHAGIGAGHIGLEPFARLLAHPLTDGVPLVVETPSDKKGTEHAADVAQLKKLRDA